MESKDDVFVFGEDRVVVHVAEPVRMLRARLELHQVDNVDHPHLQLRQVLTENGCGGQDLERGRVATAGHDHVRLAPVVARPLPDADALRAMHHGRVHRQPLRQRVLASDDHVHVVPAAQAVVDDRQKAVRVGRQVDAHDVGFLLTRDQGSRILVREAVVTCCHTCEASR